MGITMSFDIAETPTLQAVATDDERQLAEDLQERVEESIAEADASADVLEAVAAQNAAADLLARLRKAERALTQHSKLLREQIAASSRAALDGLIDSVATGGKPEFKKLGEVSAIEDQNRFAGRAIQRLIEHLIPVAQIASLREESYALLVRSRAVERIAQERAERVLGQMREAVTDEIVLPVDMSKGVAGALLAHAAGLKRCAVQLSENADRMERSHEL